MRGFRPLVLVLVSFLGVLGVLGGAAAQLAIPCSGTCVSWAEEDAEVFCGDIVDYTYCRTDDVATMAGQANTRFETLKAQVKQEGASFPHEESDCDDALKRRACWYIFSECTIDAEVKQGVCRNNCLTINFECDADEDCDGQPTELCTGGADSLSGSPLVGALCAVLSMLFIFFTWTW